jgi:hypothetical protein
VTFLRATQKVLRRLPLSTAAPSAATDTALGDWYVNRFVVDRKPLLLLLSSRSLLTILLPARELRTLPARLPALVSARLRRLGIDRSIVDAEERAMTSVTIAGTTDRAVLGYLVDFAKMVPYHLEAGRWDETTLVFVEGRLARTPCHLGRATIFPDRAVPELLDARWGVA